ncbi:outer membrane transport energization protein TonB [Nitrosovibrio tenuis]|uniref:Outer membrane transport energization protein TonB n=2 Tax=Nitrosovibrio tenuis TaxID=1233 RepID=A0A1H7LTI1_9PROT|nr:outer membrane transport energization protein TonB [Nitrosovibrio tenuis]
MRWGIVVLVLGAAVALGLWLKDFLGSDKPPPKTSLQQITLLKPPPPPPPPPPEQKPPEPVVKEEVKLPEPAPEPMDQADEPPPGPDLGIDAEGTGSGDAFGLVGKKGGADLIGGGAKGNPWAWYDAIVNDAVNSAFQEALAREKALKDKTYKVVVKMWIDATGKVTRTALVDKTGDLKVDELLKDVLQNLRALRDAPPADMPQPIKIRVTSRA